MGTERSTKDKQMAATLKERKEERTTGKCAVCYETIPVDSAKGTRYRHVCGGRKERK